MLVFLVQSNPVNTVTEGVTESARIIISGLDLEKM